MSAEWPSLILASASPRRAELLRAAGFAFAVDAADVDESWHAGEAPDRYVRRLAIAKARAVASRHPGAMVLGADTTVTVDGEILGKPADSTDAARMIRRLSGRAHQVLTGVALALDGVVREDVAATTVWFDPLTEAEIAAYVASGEPMDKAGAYGIQGLAARFVSRLDGPYDNVVGLPVELVRTLVRAVPGAPAGRLTGSCPGDILGRSAALRNVSGSH